MSSRDTRLARRLDRTLAREVCEHERKARTVGEVYGESILHPSVAAFIEGIRHARKVVKRSLGAR
ncbi:MAG TPA: hypothetical protein VJ011_03695 [Steroidobacteraceae bacterium]|nr:hypothetical protein [Steroidobacteraceae bacterium]